MNAPLSPPSADAPFVAADVEDQGVLEDPQLLERIHEPAHVGVGVLQKARVDLHLTA